VAKQSFDGGILDLNKQKIPQSTASRSTAPFTRGPFFYPSEYNAYAVFF